MIKAVCIIFVFSSLAGIANAAGYPDNKEPIPSRYISSFLSTSDSYIAMTASSTDILSDYEILLRYFIKRQERTEDQTVFLELVFNRVQEAFLKHYEQYAGFSEIFSNNTFDCATATALYASFFSDLNVDFEIWETNYHTYIKINTDKETILLETTDPWNGFNTGVEAIKLEEQYLADNLEGYLQENGLNIYKTTTPEEFVGLLHFNQAVKSFNKENYLKALEQIEKANSMYPSARIDLLKEIIINKVVLGSTSSL